MGKAFIKSTYAYKTDGTFQSPLVGVQIGVTFVVGNLVMHTKQQDRERSSDHIFHFLLFILQEQK